MCLQRILTRVFAASAAVLLLIVAGIGLSRPSQAVASSTCSGGPMLCATETVCWYLPWDSVCQTTYYYMKSGGGGGDLDPLDPCYNCGTMEP